MLPFNPYPENTAVGNVTVMPSLTYYFDRQQGRIIGRVDGIDAMVQAIDKILSTERFAYPIYTANYGTELDSLTGKSPDYVKTVLSRRVEEALLADDRVLKVANFAVRVLESDSEVMEAAFDIVTIQGRIAFKKKVKVL